MSLGKTGNKAVFLDRDGVIIANRSNYVKSWREVRFLPGVFAALALLARSSFKIIVVTNQSVIGRGIISLEHAEEINGRIEAVIQGKGGRVDRTYLCPHHPDHGCLCRKPSPGVLLKAAVDFDLELPESFLIGDAVTDIQAASAACIHGILVASGRGKEQAKLLGDFEGHCSLADDLRAAVDKIMTISVGDRGTSS